MYQETAAASVHTGGWHVQIRARVGDKGVWSIFPGSSLVSAQHPGSWPLGIDAFFFRHFCVCWVLFKSNPCLYLQIQRRFHVGTGTRREAPLQLTIGANCCYANIVYNTWYCQGFRNKTVLYGAHESATLYLINITELQCVSLRRTSCCAEETCEIPFGILLSCLVQFTGFATISLTCLLGVFPQDTSPSSHSGSYYGYSRVFVQGCPGLRS